MKKTKKIFAVILCASLALLSFGVIVQARESEPLKFVVLGDSIAEGVGARIKSNAYANRIARAKGYELSNFGKGGDTSAALLWKVTEDETIRQGIRDADIIAVSIGGNDFYPSLSLVLNGFLGEYSWMEPRREALRENFFDAVAEIRALNPDAMLIVQTLYNPLLALPLPTLYDLYDETVQGINAVIGEYLTQQPDAFLIADVYAAFQGRYGTVSIDMVHPSDCGHAIIADVLMDTIDGTQTLKPASGAINLLAGIFYKPVFEALDWIIVGMLRIVHDALPSVWERIMQL
ncbi:MAG: SGNH/GDSL hydrolase family protein [Oscillospiraceae bacterium]|nr:SGNH/GDSL hydrolase family protein [Oscillospiraceae bacterium]